MNNNSTISTIVFLILILVSWRPLNAQSPCYTDELHQERYDINPEYRHDFDVRMQKRRSLLESTQNQDRFFCVDPIIVPVAVHYNGVTSQSLSCLTDLALSQIELLNKDFSATNDEISNFTNDIFGTDIEPSFLAAEGACIQFCLADADHPPQSGLAEGDYAITVNADYIADGSYLYSDPMWAGYMNIVVPNDLFDVYGFTEILLPADGSTIVVSSCVWGSGDIECGDGFGSGESPFGNCFYTPPDYTYGKTTTHEIGHFLGLHHTWASEFGAGCNYDDGFTDTPDTDSPAFQCPINDASCGSDDMYMNFMDYADDECRYMFSEQQATFMYNRASEIWSTTTTKCSSTFTVNDASIQDILFPVNTVCGSTVAPIIRLKNEGSADLISADIQYEVIGGGSGMFSWSGNLSENESEVVSLPPVASLMNDFTLSIQTVNPNGVQDENVLNDIIEKNLVVVEGVNLPFTEDVEDFSQPFPAQGITIFSEVNDGFEWEKKIGVSGYGNGVYSILFDNFSVGNPNLGNSDWFILPEMDITGFNSAKLNFDLAYTYYESGSQVRSDELRIMYALGCSGDWQEIWSANGTDLATASPRATIYQPESSSDWVSQEIGINTDGSDYVRIAFVNITGKGNSLYLDNINVEGSMNIVSTNEIESLSKFDIAPNPSQGYLNVNVEFKQHKEFEILIHDIMGRQLYFRKQTAAISNEQLDLNEFANGVYMISIRSGNQIITEKFILSK